MQRALFGRDVNAEIVRTEHGGAVRRELRKLERPVSVRRPMHVVLTSQRARGSWSLRRHERAGREALRAMAHRFGIRIYDFANVGTHLHLLVRARRRESFQAFLRSFAGLVARRSPARDEDDRAVDFSMPSRGPASSGGGRDFIGVRHYVFRNSIQATLGVRVRRAIEDGPIRTRPAQPSLSRVGPGSTSS